MHERLRRDARGHGGVAFAQVDGGAGVEQVGHRSVDREHVAGADEHDPDLPAFRGSPTKRARLRGLGRDAAVVLGNVGTADDAPILQRALGDPEPLVRTRRGGARAGRRPRRGRA